MSEGLLKDRPSETWVITVLLPHLFRAPNIFKRKLDNYILYNHINRVAHGEGTEYSSVKKVSYSILQYPS